MKNSFIDSIKNRRSVYSLNKNVSLSDTQIQQLVTTAVKHCPSAFNSQTSRISILFGEHHIKLWDIVEEALRSIVPEDKFPKTAEKIDTFRQGYGSILFFEDTEIVSNLQKNFPAYEKNFPIWSEQSTGITQFAVWTALAHEGIGASLQHYNELIENQIKEHWHIPASWSLKAQMPFGGIAGKPKEKEFISDESRVTVFS